MPRCPTCDQVAEIAARALSKGDLYGEMLKIAGLVKPPSPKNKPKPFTKNVERLFALFVELQGKEPQGIRAIKAWKDSLRLMMQQDKFKHGQIEKMIRWVAQDVCQRGTWLGWKYQILSLPNLRKHREKILAQMFRPPQGGFDNSPPDDDLGY